MGGSGFGETPTPGRWSGTTPMRLLGETPTPGRFGLTPGGARTRWDEKPGSTPSESGASTVRGTSEAGHSGGFDPMATPVAGTQPYWFKDFEERNKPVTDEELDAILPKQGFEVSRLFFFRAWICSTPYKGHRGLLPRALVCFCTDLKLIRLSKQISLTIAIDRKSARRILADSEPISALASCCIGTASLRRPDDGLPGSTGNTTRP